MPKCHQCSNKALFYAEETGIYLCLDCRTKVEEIERERSEGLMRKANYLAQQIAHTTGVPGPMFDIPDRRPVTQRIAFGNVHVENSQIGVLNTGFLGDVDTAIGSLKKGSSNAEAEAIAALVEAVGKATDVATETRDEILELLASIGEETTRSSRRPSAIRWLLDGLRDVVQDVPAFVAAYESLRRVLGG